MLYTLKKEQTKNTPLSEPCVEKSFRSPKAVVVFLSVVSIAAFADLYGKHAVFDHLLSDPDLPEQIVKSRAGLIKNYSAQIPEQDTPEFTRLILQSLDLRTDVCPGVAFTVSTNPGIVFGFDKLPRWLVTIITGLMIVFVAWMFISIPRNQYWMNVALALIMGGAIGNFYDRLFSNVQLPGLEPITTHVRDFIDCRSLGYPYIFNPADVFLVAGAIMILLNWLWEIRKQESKKKTA